ncbi:jg8745 [Pararge aegeria aegeria]|uniref:Jg8745 protein n=1 Tax=Pararge aegeria aegeria TaxID=348720 RepID=A0A8S4QRF1_9NEOP|nr:jg8745 [Pararge aegeria aegeria]
MFRRLAANHRAEIKKMAANLDADDAYDAAHYFIDDVKDPWKEDALDRERVSQHSQLRELVARGDASGLKARLESLGSAAGIVANLTPGGANTLLYV